MKYLITLLLLASCLAYTTAQDCKWELNEVDAFSGKKVLKTKAVSAGLNLSWNFRTDMNGNPLVQLRILQLDRGDIQPFFANYFSIKMQDGTILDLPIDLAREAIPYDNNGTWMEGDFVYYHAYISLEDLRMVCKQPMTDLRIYTSLGYLDFSIRKRPDIMRIARCLEAELTLTD
jgi:hypothetical protein